MMHRLLPALIPLVAGMAHAAGHFDVDDAGTLDPGQCQYEAWATRVSADKTTLLHLGPACRVGPVELGLNIDRVSIDGNRFHTLGPQLKWTFLGQAPEAAWSAALSMTVNFDLPRRGRNGGQFVVPVTWRATESLQIHANLGYDWAAGDGLRTGRRGVAGEWALDDAVSLIAERNRAFGLWTTRVGLRYSLTPLISIDVSTSQSGPAAVRSWVIGLNHEFGRR